MTVAAKLDTDGAQLMSWAQIREQHPDEWVCLLDVEDAADGSIHMARVIGHGRSVITLVEELDLPLPDTVLTHTEGRRLTMPRIEMTDEIRELLRSDR